MKGLYYDRDGNDIDMLGFVALAESGSPYRFVAQTKIISAAAPDGWRISTIWVGIDYSWGEGPPLIFETMTFADGADHDRDCWRWHTEEEARAGHDRIVQEMTDLASVGGEEIRVVDLIATRISLIKEPPC